MSRSVRAILGSVAAALLAGGCTAPAPAGEATQTAVPSSGPATARTPERELPPTTGVFDYQLGGAAPQVVVNGTARDIDIVVRDARTEALPGAYSICYVNGFQTQDDERALWLDHQDLLLSDDEGKPLEDPEWPGEFILDPSTETRRAEILAILGPRIAGCAKAGYQAVEIDDLDTWTRFPDRIAAADARSLAARYVALAHENGLAVAQKNAPDIAPVAHAELGFDLAIAEECAAYDECGAYTRVYGDHVLHVEYADSLTEEGTTFAEACARTDRAPHMILRDRELRAPGTGDWDSGAPYRYETC